MLIRNGVLILGAMALFGVIHSLTAGLAPRARLKRVLDDRLVEGWYRLAYNVFSAITMLPVLAALVLLPDQVVYRVEGPLAWLMRGVQLVGLAGLVGALAVTDVWRFLGLRQAAAYLQGDPLPLPELPLVVRGMYRVTRHPLYFFSLLVIWLMPEMTLNMLLFNIGATAYLAAGSLVEEQRLLKRHGEGYREYRRQTSWLVPFPARKAANVPRPVEMNHLSVQDKTEEEKYVSQKHT